MRGGAGVTALLFLHLPAVAKLKRFLLAGGLLMVVLVSAGIGTGAIDKAVVLESPRSMQFRLLYWIGAAGVIRDEPVFGAGPGNFRQVYLQHKPVESSEEILDPHNIILDAWCTAGFPGFVGVCLIGFSVLRTLMAVHQEANANTTQSSRINSTAHINKTAALGVGGAMIFHLLWRWGSGEQLWDTGADSFWESQNLTMLLPVCALVSLRLIPPDLDLPRKAVAAGTGTLLVHLLGAGGLQITGIGLLLLLAHSLAGQKAELVDSLRRKEPAVDTSSLLYRLGMTTILCLCGWAILNHGILPFIKAERQLAASRAHEERKDITGALKRSGPRNRCRPSVCRFAPTHLRAFYV